MIVLLPIQLAIICGAILWVDEILPLLNQSWLDFKPVNCSLCVSFWISVILGLLTIPMLTPLEFIYLVVVTPIGLRYLEGKL